MSNKDFGEVKKTFWTFLKFQNNNILKKKSEIRTCSGRNRRRQGRRTAAGTARRCPWNLKRILKQWLNLNFLKSLLRPFFVIFTRNNRLHFTTNKHARDWLMRFHYMLFESEFRSCDWIINITPFYCFNLIKLYLLITHTYELKISAF